MKPGVLPLVALGLGAAAYFLTQQVVVGLFVTGAAFWVLRRPSRAPGPRVPEPRAHKDVLEPSEVTERPLTRAERSMDTRVVCKQVNSERQEWTSLRTGRIFEVLSQNGPPGAQPGDQGEVFISEAGYRIRLLIRKG